MSSVPVIRHMSLAVKFDNTLIGVLRERLALTYRQVFWAGGLIMILPLVLLFALNTGQVGKLNISEAR